MFYINVLYYESYRYVAATSTVYTKLVILSNFIPLMYRLT